MPPNTVRFVDILAPLVLLLLALVGYAAWQQWGLAVVQATFDGGLYWLCQ